MGCIFEEVLQLYDIGVRQTHLNRHFLLQLFLSILRLQCFFRNYLACKYFFVFADAGELDAGGKCTLAELLASDVLDDSAVCSFFFDHGAGSGVDLNLDVFVGSRKREF